MLAHTRLPAVCLVTVILAYLPLLAKHLWKMSQSPETSHFGLVFICAILLAIRDSHQYANSPKVASPPWVGTSLFCGALITFAGATYFRSIWGSIFSFNVFVLAWILSTSQWKTLWAAWVTLLLLLPLPLGLDQRLVLWLQGKATSAASSILDILYRPHVLLGNIIELPGGSQMLVSEACSGLRSLFAVCTLCAIYCLWTRTRLSKTIFILASAVFFTWVSNVLRIILVVFSADQEHWNFSRGRLHDLLGFAVLILSLTLITSAVSAMQLGRYAWGQGRKSKRMKQREEYEERVALEEIPSGPSLPQQLKLGLAKLIASGVPQWKGTFLASIIFISVAVVQQVRGMGETWISLITLSKVERTLTQTLGKLTPDSLPQEISGFYKFKFERVDRSADSILGSHSQRWIFRAENWNVSLSIDYTFPTFHPLEVCYLSQGWRVTQFGNLGEPSQPTATHMDLASTRGEYAYVIYNGFTSEHESGDTPPPLSPLGAIYARTLSSVGSPVATRWYQFQLFVSSALPFSTEDKTRLVSLYMEASKQLLLRLKGASHAR